MWHGMAWHGMAWHGITWYGMAPHGTAWHNMVRHGMARHGRGTVVATKKCMQWKWHSHAHTVNITVSFVRLFSTAHHKGYLPQLFLANTHMHLYILFLANASLHTLSKYMYMYFTCIYIASHYSHMHSLTHCAMYMYIHVYTERY